MAFTSRSLANDVTANAIAAVTRHVSGCHAADIETLRVADPFCGTGAFLLSAARYLGDALAAAWDKNDQREIAGLCTLYGTPNPVMAARALEITHSNLRGRPNPVSVELAGLALQLLALGGPRAPR